MVSIYVIVAALHVGLAVAYLALAISHAVG
jgi:hypothetical protein